ncbi:putative yddA [Escherichia coli BCE011_MS-01]|nr:putative yddA [Escherichia coli BCE011_MS-01]
MCGTRQDNGQGPAATTKRGLRNGVAPYIPASFCRDARSAGHGATEAARPERSLQARGFHASDRSDSPKPRQRVRRRLAGAPAAACRSRA